MIKPEIETSTDAINFLTTTIKSIVKIVLKDHNHSSNLLENPELLGNLVRENVNKTLFMIGISNFMNSYEVSYCNAESEEKVKLIRKMIHLAYKVEKEKLKSLYSIMKNVVNYRENEDSVSSKAKLENSCYDHHSEKSSLLGKKTSRTSESSISESESSIKRSVKTQSQSTLDFVPYSKKNLLKSINFQSNTIGNLIVNVNSGVLNNKGDSCQLQKSSTLTFATETLNLNQDKVNNQLDEKAVKSRSNKPQIDCKFKFDPLSLEKYSQMDYKESKDDYHKSHFN